MKKILLLLVVALSLFSCDKEEVEIPQRHAGRTVLAFFWADTTEWLNDSLRMNIKNMMVGLRSMTDSATLVVYWDGKSNDPNWPTPVIVKYESDGRGSINGYSKEAIDAMMSDKSATNDLVGIGKIQKTYPSQTSTDKEVMQTVISDMVNCYPSESYGIMFGSHGSGWLPSIFGRSIGQDGGEYSSNTAMIPELAEALRVANPQKFDFILLDACMMGCAEVYYELKDVTRYCIASVLDIPGAGFPYKSITPYLYEENIREYLPAICKNYIDTYNKGDHWGTIAAIDCNRMEYLAAATRKVITAHKDNLNTVNTASLQQYGRSGQNFKGYAYDMVQYVETLCGGKAPADFTACFEDAVVYAGYASNVSYSMYKIDGDNYCGIGMYVPNSSTSGKYALWNNYFKSSIAWYEAAGWAETESIWGN